MSVKSVRNVDIPQLANQLEKSTAGASTLQELIFTIPQSYRAQLGDYLQKKYRIAHKHANVQSTITAYERHQTDATFPPIIRNSLKDPKLQFAKEFLLSNDGKDSQETFQASIAAARAAVLAAALAEKKKELACLAEQIKAETTIWNAAVINVATKLTLTYGGTVENGKLQGLPAPAKTEYDTLHGACSVYTYRCLALARASIDRADLQKFSKLTLKKEVDVTMTDTDNNQSVKDIVREEIQSLRKELKGFNAVKSKKPAGRVQKSQSTRAKAGGKNKKKQGKKSR